ncbi:MAG: DNA-binding protein [Thermoplasmata archaeon]
MGDDEELEELRRRKLMELQAQKEQLAEARERAAALEAQRQAILRGILTPEARERLGRLRTAYPEIAAAVEQQLIALAQSGRLGDHRIDDLTLRQLLERIVPQKREIRIVRR